MINGVEELLLDAIAPVELRFRDDLVDFFIHALCAAITVGDSIAEHIAVGIEQDEVDAPGVDTDTLGDAVELLALAQALHDLMEKMIEIPAQMAIALL